MKLLKIISLVVATALTAHLSTHAATIQTDTWSASGGAWNPTNQPTYVAKNGGTLNPDTLSDSGASLYVSPFTVAAPPTFTNYGTGLYNDFFYTFFSTPSLTVSTSNVLTGVGAITFNLVSSAVLSDLSVALNYGASFAANSFSSIVVGHDGGFNVDIVSYTWTWDVGSLPAEDDFSLGWITPSQHSVYYSATLTQTLAVPEPTSFALIAISSAALYLNRRRRSAH